MTRLPPVAWVTVELRLCHLTPRVHVVGAGDGLAAVMASGHGVVTLLEADPCPLT